MKQKMIALLSLLIFSTGINFAVDSKNENPQNNLNQDTKWGITDDKLNQTDALNDLASTYPVVIKSKKEVKLFQKLKKKNFMPQMIKALVFVGLLVMLVGALLAALGVALIPAIVLAVVGCVLMILGALL